MLNAGNEVRHWKGYCCLYDAGTPPFGLLSSRKRVTRSQSESLNFHTPDSEFLTLPFHFILVPTWIRRSRKPEKKVKRVFSYAAMVALNFDLSPDSCAKLFDLLSCLAKFNETVSLEAQKESVSICYRL